MDETYNELSILAKALYTLMVQDPAYLEKVGKRFYEEMVPEGGTLPAGMSVYMGGKDINGAFGTRSATNGNYQIKGLCKGNSYGPLEGLSNDIDRILTGVRQYKFQAERTDGGLDVIRIVSILRIDTIKYSRVDEGGRENHMGGLYRIIAYTES